MKIPEIPLRTNSAACSFVHAGGNHQDLAAKSALTGQTHELSAISVTEVEVEQHDINTCSLQCSKSFLDGITMRRDLEAGFARQQSGHTLPEQGMIIH